MINVGWTEGGNFKVRGRGEVDESCSRAQTTTPNGYSCIHYFDG